MHHNFIPTFASYSYHKVGFPHVQLKWNEGELQVNECYVTVKGIIKMDAFKFQRDGYGGVDFRNEIPRFEKWVVDNYGNDATVQG